MFSVILYHDNRRKMKEEDIMSGERASGSQNIEGMFSTQYENERLRRLQEYNILDSLPEKDFDNLVAIAKNIFNTDEAAITFLDKDRQWIKSITGGGQFETPRSVAFCDHTIREKNQVLTVEDTLEDERFRENPYVTGDPKIRFYAGAPLTTEDGYALGAICITDSQPKQLSDEQKSALLALRDQVIHLLELRQNRALLEEQIKKQLEFEARLTAAQVNPNLVFTLMTHFQSLMMNGEIERSLNLSSQLTNMMRIKYHCANSLYHELSDDIAYTKAFFELITLNFSKQPKLNISVSNPKFMKTKVAPMLLQPLIENAVKHGFRGAQEVAELSVKFEKKADFVRCTVEDNGEGREGAIDISKTRNQTDFMGSGLRILQKRLDLYSQLQNRKFEMKIFDKSGEAGKGTIITLDIPIAC